MSGIELTIACHAFVPLLAEGAEAGEAAPSGIANMLPMFAIMFTMFYFLVLRPQRAKEQQLRAMLDNLKEKDRVLTVGGIYGVVTQVQRDADVITIRVDEATGAKLRVTASSISRVLVDEDKAIKKQVSKNGAS